MKSKYANAYLFADRLIVHSYLQTPYGSFAIGPFQRLDRSAPAEEVGRSVLAALAASIEQKEMPPGKETTKIFLAGVGVKSNAQLQRGATSVGIRQTPTELEFTATHNGGTAGDQKGFQPLRNSSPLRLPAVASLTEIGTALMDAFGRCTTIYG